MRALVTVADDPTLMLNGPVPAARKALAQAGMKIGDIGLFEVNEAFAVVPLKFMNDLGIDPAKVNVNGGAMALGHPIGATGAILAGTLFWMRWRDRTLRSVWSRCVPPEGSHRPR